MSENSDTKLCSSSAPAIKPSGSSMINAEFLVTLGFLPEDNPDEFGLHIWDKTDAEDDPEHDENHPNHQWLFKVSDQSLWLEAYDACGKTLALTELPSLNRNNLIALISLLSHHEFRFYPQTEFCPHSHPNLYCNGCKVSPCPVGLD